MDCFLSDPSTCGFIFQIINSAENIFLQILWISLVQTKHKPSFKYLKRALRCQICKMNMNLFEFYIFRYNWYHCVYRYFVVFTDISLCLLIFGCVYWYFAVFIDISLCLLIFRSVYWYFVVFHDIIVYPYSTFVCLQLIPEDDESTSKGLHRSRC